MVCVAIPYRRLDSCWTSRLLAERTAGVASTSGCICGDNLGKTCWGSPISRFVVRIWEVGGRVTICGTLNWSAKAFLSSTVISTWISQGTVAFESTGLSWVESVFAWGLVQPASQSFVIIAHCLEFSFFFGNLAAQFLLPTPFVHFLLNFWRRSSFLAKVGSWAGSGGHLRPQGAHLATWGNSKSSQGCSSLLCSQSGVVDHSCSSLGTTQVVSFLVAVRWSRRSQGTISSTSSETTSKVVCHICQISGNLCVYIWCSPDNAFVWVTFFFLLLDFSASRYWQCFWSSSSCFSQTCLFKLLLNKFLLNCNSNLLLPPLLQIQKWKTRKVTFNT